MKVGKWRNGYKLLLMAEILHQLIDSLSRYFQGFIHPRWCRISAINSMSIFKGFLAGTLGCNPWRGSIQPPQILVIFTPILGEDSHSDEYFSNGWFNHEILLRNVSLLERVDCSLEGSLLEGNYLENQLLLISTNFTPKTSHSCQKKLYTRFSR